MKPPANARYSKLRYQFVKDTVVTTGAPSATNIVSRWYVDSDVYLPAGLTLNEETGEISGTPTDVLDMTSFTIYAENESGATSTSISIHIVIGECSSDQGFPPTPVGDAVVLACSHYGNYWGSIKRVCVIGKENGEWSALSSHCYSISLSITLAVVALLVIAFVTYIAYRYATRHSQHKAPQDYQLQHWLFSVEYS